MKGLPYIYWEFEGHLGALTQNEVNLKAVISTVGLLTENTWNM